MMSTPASLAQLREVGYFRDLSAADLQWLSAGAAVHRYGARESVLREGEPCAGLYAVLEGQARIYKSSRAGRQQVLAVLQAGDTFNEVPVFDGGANPASVETLQPSAMLVVPREAALALIARSPQAALLLLGAFASRLRGFAALVESLAFDDVTRRLARFITQLARMQGRQTAEGLVLQRLLTVQDVAAMVGSVREVVTRSLALLESQGLIIVRPSAFAVPDLAALQRFAED